MQEATNSGLGRVVGEGADGGGGHGGLGSILNGGQTCRAGQPEPALSMSKGRLSLCESLQRDTLQRFVDFYDAYLISEAGPATKDLGIFLRGSAGFLRLPVTQQNVVRFAVAIQKVTAGPLDRKDGDQFPGGRERC